MLRVLGAVLAILILVGITTHMDGHEWTVMTLFIGATVTAICIVVWIIRRAWRR